MNEWILLVNSIALLLNGVTVLLVIMSNRKRSQITWEEVRRKLAKTHYTSDDIQALRASRENDR